MIKILYCRDEQGESMKLSQAQLLAQLEKRAPVDETEIKRKIMDNYGFVDMENDSKYHRPIVSKKNVSINDHKLLVHQSQVLSSCHLTFPLHIRSFKVDGGSTKYKPYLRVLSEVYKLHKSEKELREDPELDNF